MSFWHNGNNFKSAKDVVSNILSGVRPKNCLFNIYDKLYASRIMEITNHQGEDYIIRLICFDDEMRKHIVAIHSQSLDWLDFMASNKDRHTKKDAEDLADALMNYDEISHTEIIKGRWTSIDSEVRWWVRGYLSRFTKKRGFLQNIEILNEILIGNRYLPTKNINHFGKARVAGVPLFEWFNFDKAFYAPLDSNFSSYNDRAVITDTGFQYKDDDGKIYNYDERSNIWIDENDEMIYSPIDKDVIHVNLDDIKILENTDHISPVYLWLCHDIEVSNAEVMKRSDMPDIKNLDSQINTISFKYMNASNVLKEFSIVSSPFETLNCENDVICVHSEMDLMKCVIWTFYLTDMIYLADYNGLGFDNPWLAHRITAHGLQSMFMNMFSIYQTNRHLIDIMAKYVKSTSGGKKKHGAGEDGVSIRTKHFAHIDFMYYVATREIYDKRTGKSLNAVAAHYGLGQKLEIEHWRVSLIRLAYDRIFNVKSNHADMTDKISEPNDMIERSNEFINDMRVSISQFRLNAMAIDKPEYQALIKGDLKTFLVEYRHLMTSYVDYCLMDVRLCVDLILKNDLFDTFHGMGRIYALPAETILYSGINVTIKNLLLMFMIKNNFTFHEYNEFEISQRESMYGNVDQIGGITLEAYEQNHDDPIIDISCDLSGAYPASMDDFNISPEMIYLPRYDVNGNIKMPFAYTAYHLKTLDGYVKTLCIRSDRRGVMAMFQESLILLRAQYKTELKRHIINEDPDYVIKAANVNQLAIKLAANATYGQYGSEYNKNSWLHSSACSSMTTISTASTILLVMLEGFIEYGAISMIGVTDSASFRIEKEWCKIFGLDDSRESRYKIVRKIKNALINRFNARIKDFTQLEKCKSNIAAEYIGASLNIQKMKRYAIRILDDKKPTYKEAHESGYNKVVGYSQVRQNTSYGIRTLSDEILQMLLGYEIMSKSDIVDAIINYFDAEEEEYFRWSNFERVSINNPSMRQFQLRSGILYKTDIGYSAPPIFGSQIHVIPIDHGCRCVSVGKSLAPSWPVGMTYMYADDARRMGFKIYKAKISDRIGKVCDEVIGINSPITASIRDILKKRDMKIKHNHAHMSYRIIARNIIAADINIDDLKYVSFDILRAHTTAFDILTTQRMYDIDNDYIVNKTLNNNPILMMSVNSVKTFLEEKMPLMTGGIIAELTVQLSKLSASLGGVIPDGYQSSEHYIKSMIVLKGMLYKLDRKFEQILSNINIVPKKEVIMNLDDL